MNERVEEKPFIFLLKSHNGKYFYDVNRNDVVSINDEVYNILKKIERNNTSIESESTHVSIEQLRNLGYLSTKRVKEVKHPASDYLEEYLERKVKKLTLQVTQSCNLRCSYCVYSDINNDLQRTHSNKFMSFETARKSIDFLANHSIDCNDVNISFYGGEPLLAFDLIKKVVSYAKELLEGKQVTFNITSNATLLNDEIIQFFIREKVQLMVSVDGPEQIHDTCRRYAADGAGTFKTIMNNLNYIKEKYPEYMDKVHVSMVINPQNEFDCINSIFADYDIFNRINVHSAVIDDVYSVEKTSFSENYSENQSYQYFLAYLSRFGRLDNKYVSPLANEEILAIENEINKLGNSRQLPDVSAPGGPCIPGQLRLFCDIEGNLFPCERVNEKSEAMWIGSIDKGINLKNAYNLLNVGSLSPEECKNCWAFEHCTLCAKYADDCGELCKNLKLTKCQSVKNIFKNKLLDIIMINEVERIYL